MLYPWSGKRVLRFAGALAALVLVWAVKPAMAITPEDEAEILLLSAAGKLDRQDLSEAGKDLERIRQLPITPPVEYYFQYGRYLAETRQADEAKKNLMTYLDKAGRDGNSYQAAKDAYSHVEASEKRWSRYRDNGDGTVTDTKTGLMWAARDNGGDIDWPGAKAYCDNFRVGGHADWRLPTQDELVGLHDLEEPGNITPLIDISACCPWASEARDEEAALFAFHSGERYWNPQSFAGGARALPVRGGK